MCLEGRKRVGRLTVLGRDRERKRERERERERELSLIHISEPTRQAS